MDLGESNGRWGDYDNDGDPDVLLTGYKNNVPYTRLYRNDGADIFTEIQTGFLPLEWSEGIWGDFDNDNDGDLDVLLNGDPDTPSHLAYIFENDRIVSNTPPSIPENLNTIVSNDSVIFSWDHAFDNETPSPGLTYNIRIGTAPLGYAIVSPMALNAVQRLLQSMAIPFTIPAGGSMVSLKPLITGRCKLWIMVLPDQNFHRRLPSS